MLAFAMELPIMTLFTKFTMAVAGCSGSSSANTWHWLSDLCAGFLATNPKHRLERRNVTIVREYYFASLQVLNLKKKKKIDRIMISKHIKKEQRTGRWPIGRSPRWRNPRCAPPCPNRNNWYYSWDNAYGRTTFARYPSEWSLGWKLWNELWSRRATAFARTWSSLPSWWLEARSTIPCPWWTGTKHCRLEEKTINGTNLRKFDPRI